MTITELKTGRLVVYQQRGLPARPYRVKHVNFSQPGKHGHVKATAQLEDLFTKKRVDALFTSDDKVQVPEAQRHNYQVLYVDDGYLEVLDNNCEQQSYDARQSPFRSEFERLGENSVAVVLTCTWMAGDEYVTQSEIVGVEHAKEPPPLPPLITPRTHYPLLNAVLVN